MALHLYPNISKCHDKLVYMDTTEHILELLDYLNDNRDGIVFMKGSDDEFLLTYFGIQIDPYQRNNYVLDRLKVLISSGIYNWWEAWFRKNKKRKLFPHYANWTGPNFDALERRDFFEKFEALGKIWALSCIMCIIVYAIEWIDHGVNLCKGLLAGWVYGIIYSYV
ncbi:hypothetical protein Fcan01_15499 [Folsomia candida]|uniref:Uncharacterized protein n=1 Tax=Folsomia candida TaxID=158441 RepID=A0A226DWV1_FOLCA|nr:hypothetical protein Fcan01_15499 [Folsomia candida]